MSHQRYPAAAALGVVYTGTLNSVPSAYFAQLAGGRLRILPGFTMSRSSTCTAIWCQALPSHEKATTWVTGLARSFGVAEATSTTGSSLRASSAPYLVHPASASKDTTTTPDDRADTKPTHDAPPPAN